MRKLFSAVLWLALPVLALAGTIPSPQQAYSAWDPRNYRNQLGLWSMWDAGMPKSLTPNSGRVKTWLDAGFTSYRTENLALQSEAFNTTWVLFLMNAFGATDTGALNAGSFANTARTTDPLGGNTAEFVQESTGTGGHAVELQNIQITDTGWFLLSIYAKNAGRDDLLLRLYDSSTGGYAHFGLNGLVADVPSVLGSVGGIVGTPTITDAGNSWRYCTVPVYVTAANTAWMIDVFLSNTNNGAANYTGDGTKGLYLWGAHLRRRESSSTYLQTTTVAQASDRGLLQMTAGNQPYYTNSGGGLLGGYPTVYCDGAATWIKNIAAKDLVQPYSVFFLGKQINWNLNNAIYDGYPNALLGTMYQHTNSPDVAIYAGTIGQTNSSWTLGTWGLMTGVFAGTSSRMDYNSTNGTPNDIGTTAPLGFMLGARGDGTRPVAFQTGLILITAGKTNAPGELSYLRWRGLKQAGIAVP